MRKLHRRVGRKRDKVMTKSSVSDEPIVDSAFIMSDGEVISAQDLMKKGQQAKTLIEKEMEGSNQPDTKDEDDEVTSQDIVYPPFDPETMAKFLDVDEVHYRCFTDDVTVLTKDLESRSIASIKKGERVLSHNNDFYEVTDVMKFDVEEELVLLDVHGLRTISSTSEHPYLVVDSSFADFRAKITREKRVSGLSGEGVLLSDKANELLSWKNASEIAVGDFIVGSLPLWKMVDETALVFQGQKIVASDELCELLGFYLAEGSCSDYEFINKRNLYQCNYSTVFTFHKDEKDYHQRVMNGLSNCFDSTSKVYFDEEKNTGKIVCSKPYVHKLMTFLGGKFCYGKRIQKDFLARLELRQILILLRSYFDGDGHINKNGDCIFVTTSKELSKQLFTLLSYLRYDVSVYEQQPISKRRVYRLDLRGQDAKDFLSNSVGSCTNSRKRNCFTSLLGIGEVLLRKVISSEQKSFSGSVYNLEVEGSHTFVANGLVTHNCVKTKVMDAVGREYVIAKKNKDEKDTESSSQSVEVEDFIENCNENDRFEGVLEKAATDYESVGYCFIEVVRALDKKIRRLYHIPVARMRVLKGWTGFAELGGANSGKSGTYRYYLPFGRKLLSPNRTDINNNPLPFDPAKDGKFSAGKWNMKGKDDLNSDVSRLQDSATEVMMLTKPHPKSMYYGVPDVIPAIGSIMGNINIRDFFLQFFDHNAVPQYAVIITGAKLSNEVKEVIQRYFAQDIKGQAHKTLVIPIPAAGGDVKVEFKKLTDDTQEGSFQDTRKNNQEAILVAHGMSAAIVGMTDSASLGSGKGDAQSSNYKNRIVDPLQRRWEKMLSRLFHYGLGTTSVKIVFESLDVTDKANQRENLLAFMEKGVISINDIRDIAQLGPPVKGGDKPFILTGGIPLFVDEIQAMPTEAEMKLAGDKLNKIAEKMAEG